MQAKLKEQSERYYDTLDERTAHSIDAMDARAQQAWDSQDEKRYEREFPGMSGEKIPRFIGDSSTGEFKIES